MIGPKFYAWDRDGKPLAFGKLYTYQARTNTPKPTYQSEDQVVENTNPVILNGEGYANVYLDGAYKMVLKDDKENEIWSADPVTSNKVDEWVNCFTVTYASSSSFKIGGNVTTEYEIGRRVRIDNNTSNYSYSTIQTSSYVAGETTVVVGDPVVTTGVVGACTSIVGPESLSISNSVIYFDDVEEAINSTRLSVLGGQVLNIGGYESKGDSGKATWYTVLVGTISDNGVNKRACVGVPGLAIVRRETIDINPKISFVFDDAWNSTLGDLKTLFDARGYKLAAAIPIGSLGNPNRLKINDIPKLQQAGFEVINHNVSGDVANTASYGQAKIRAEVQTCNSALNAVGVDPVGFQAPSSTMNDEYLNEVARVCPFAFTVDSKLTPIIKGQNPLKLHRYSIEGNTEQACSDAVDLVAKVGGTIVFYAHDIATDDSNYDKIVAIMDRAEELAVVDIVSVSESIKAVTEVPQKAQHWFSGDLIDNDPNVFKASGDSTISVSNVSDVYVTANVVQQTLVQATFDLPSDITNGELITFSAALRSISGTFGTNNTIGIQLKDAGNTVLYSDEIVGGTLNTAYPRYNVSAVMVNAAVKATVFMRVDATSIGAQALIRNPVLRFGNDVNYEVFTSESMSITTSIIPAQTLAHSSQQTLTLTDEVDNGRYKIESNQLIITSDWEGSLHGTLSGVQQDTSGGYIAWLLSGGGGGSVAIATLNTNNGTSYGCSSIAGKFIKGASFTLICQPYAVDFNVSSSIARITSLGKA
jgi:hypothetical protein